MTEINVKSQEDEDLPNSTCDSMNFGNVHSYKWLLYALNSMHLSGPD